jgi:hypothetical protein
MGPAPVISPDRHASAGTALGSRRELSNTHSLSRPDAGMNVVFVRRGLATLPGDQRDIHAAGLILAFVVDDLEGELPPSPPG